MGDTVSSLTRPPDATTRTATTHQNVVQNVGQNVGTSLHASMHAIPSGANPTEGPQTTDASRGRRQHTPNIRRVFGDIVTHL